MIYFKLDKFIGGCSGGEEAILSLNQLKSLPLRQNFMTSKILADAATSVARR